MPHQLIPSVPLQRKKLDEEEKPKDVLTEILEDDGRAKTTSVAIASAEGQGHSETPQVDEKPGTTLNKLSPLYGNQIKGEMDKQNGAKGVIRTPTIPIFGCGGSGAKIIVNDVLKEFVGPVVTRTVDVNNIADLDVRGAIVGKNRDQIRREIMTGDANKEYVDVSLNFQGLDVKPYTIDWSGDLRLTNRAPNACVTLSGTTVPHPSFGTTLDDKFPCWSCITYSDTDESLTGKGEELHTGNSLAVGHAFMRGMQVRKEDIAAIAYSLPEFMKFALSNQKDPKSPEYKQIDLDYAIAHKQIVDLKGGWIYIPGKIDVDLVNSAIKIPIRYRMVGREVDSEKCITDNYNLADADIRLVILLSSMSGGTGGAITDGIADLLYDMKKYGWENIPIRREPAFLTWAGRTYPQSLVGSDAPNAVVNLLGIMNKSRRVAKGVSGEQFMPAINTDIVVSTAAVYAAGEATVKATGQAPKVNNVAVTDKSLVDIIMNFASALNKPLQGARGTKDSEVKEFIRFMSGRTIAGYYEHANELRRPSTRDAVLDELRVLAKPVSHAVYKEAHKIGKEGEQKDVIIQRDVFNGLFTKQFEGKEFFDNRMTPSEYVDTVIAALKMGKTKEEIKKDIPDAKVPIEYLTPTQVMFALTSRQQKPDSYQYEAKYLVDEASVIWRHATAISYTGTGKNEATSVLIGGPSTVTTEDLIVLYENTKTVYNSFNKDTFRKVFANGDKNLTWQILDEEELPYVENSEAQLEVIAATSDAVRGKGLYAGDNVLKTFAYMYNAIYDRESLRTPEGNFYDFGKPKPIVFAPVTAATPVPIRVAEPPKKESYWAKGLSKFKDLANKAAAKVKGTRGK